MNSSQIGESLEVTAPSASQTQARPWSDDINDASEPCFPFPLFDSAGLQNVSLGPEPLYPPEIVGKPPPAEDNPTQARLRSLQAESIAVDYEWVLKEAIKPNLPYPSSRSKLVDVSTSLPAPPPAMMLIASQSAQAHSKNLPKLAIVQVTSDATSCF